MEFNIEIVENWSEIKLTLKDNGERFSRKDRAELEERLRRPKKPLVCEKFTVILTLCDFRRPLDYMKMLGEGLHEIRKADLFNRCTIMKIRFSPTVVDIDTQSQAFKELRSLTLPYTEMLIFIGHRTQFPLIFGFGKTPQRLRYLELWCELTVCDCAYLLKENSDTLRVLVIKRLALCDYRIPTMFPGFRSHLIEGRVRMTTFERLEITDLFVNPTEMLNKFEMSSLCELRLNVGKKFNRRGITQKDLKWIPWKKVICTDVPAV